MVEFNFDEDKISRIPENGEYLGKIDMDDIFNYYYVKDLLESYEMGVGLYMLGHAGGMIGVALANEIVQNYDITGVKLNLYAMNTARVDFTPLIKRFPPQLRKNLSIIPIGVKESEYKDYLNLIKQKRELEAKLKQARESNDLKNVHKLTQEIMNINKRIKLIQRKLSGSGSFIETGLSKFQESYSLLEGYFMSRQQTQPEDAHILVGSFAGGSGSALFIEMSKLLKQVNKESLIIAYGLAPFKSERKKKSLRVQNYIKAVQGTRPNVNLLIEVDPSKVTEQLERVYNKRVNFMDLNAEFGRKNAQFIITLMLTNNATEFSQVTQDFMDLKRIVGNNAVGDLTFYNNMTPNGGFMSLRDTIQEKLLPDMMRMPSRVLIYYDIPKSVSVADVEEANNLITRSTDAIVYFGVTQRTNDNDKEIRLYTVTIRDESERKETSEVMDAVVSVVESDDGIKDLAVIEDI